MEGDFICFESFLAAYKVKKKESNSESVSKIVEFAQGRDTLILNFGKCFEQSHVNKEPHLYILEYNSIHNFENLPLLFSINLQIIEWLHSSNNSNRMLILCIQKLENLLLILSIYYTCTLEFTSCVHAFEFLWKEFFHSNTTNYLYFKSFYRYVKYCDFLLQRSLLPDVWNFSLLQNTRYQIQKIRLQFEKVLDYDCLVILQQHGNILSQSILDTQKQSAVDLNMTDFMIQMIGDFVILLASIQKGKLITLGRITCNTIFLCTQETVTMEWKLNQIDFPIPSLQNISMELSPLSDSEEESESYTESLFSILSQFEFCKQIRETEFTKLVSPTTLYYSHKKSELAVETVQEDSAQQLLSPQAMNKLDTVSCPSTPLHQIRQGQTVIEENVPLHNAVLETQQHISEGVPIPSPPPICAIPSISIPPPPPILPFHNIPPPTTTIGNIPAPPIGTSTIPLPPPTIPNGSAVAIPLPLFGSPLKHTQINSFNIPQGTPLKVLHWNQIPFATMQQDSVWNSFKFTPNKSVDVTLLENLFRKNTKPSMNESKPFSSLCAQSPVRRAFQEKTKVNTISILDPKRSRNIEIVLNNLKHINTVEVVENLELYALEKSKFEFLLGSCILEDPQERESMSIYSVGNLAKSDAFVYQFNQIALVKEKLMVIIILQDLESSIQQVIQSIQKKLRAFDQIKHSKSFQKMLEVLLIVGNIMNRNARKTVTRGFRLDILCKLQDFKSNNKSITLLDYFVYTLKKLETDNKSNFTSAIFDELNCIKDASLISKQAIRQNYNDIQQHVGNLEKVEQLMQTYPMHFSKNFEEKFTALYQIIKKLKNELEFMKSNYESEFTEVLRYFGQNVQDYNDADEVFFQQIVSFLQAFQQAIQRDALKNQTINSI